MRARAKFNRQLKSISIGYVQDNISVNDIIKIPNFAEIVYNETLDAIKEAKDKKKAAVLFDINNTGNIHKLERENFVPALESAKIYYEKTQRFEKCAEIRDLIKEINEGFKQDNTSSEQPVKRTNRRRNKKEKGDDNVNGA